MRSPRGLVFAYYISLLLVQRQRQRLLLYYNYFILQSLYIHTITLYTHTQEHYYIYICILYISCEDRDGGRTALARAGVVGRGLSNFLLFVFHVGRGRWLDDDCAEDVRWKWGTKDRRDIVLAIYIYQSPAHTHTSAGVYIYANVTRNSLFSWVDAITDGKFASHSAEEGRILYYNLLYIYTVLLYKRKGI